MPDRAKYAKEVYPAGIWRQDGRRRVSRCGGLHEAASETAVSRLSAASDVGIAGK
jgi:hypothetical protein